MTGRRKTSLLKEIKPIGDRILIEAFTKKQQEEVTKSGIILPSSNGPDKEQTFGKVLAVGETVETVHPGDMVVYSPYNKDEMKFRSKDYLLLPLKNILAVVDMEDADNT